MGKELNIKHPMLLKTKTKKTYAVFFKTIHGARCSSVVECPLMVRWVIGSIPRELILFPTSAALLVNKRDLCFPVCGMVYVKDPFLLVGNINPYSSSNGFPLSLSEWSFTTCTKLNKMC